MEERYEKLIELFGNDDSYDEESDDGKEDIMFKSKVSKGLLLT